MHLPTTATELEDLTRGLPKGASVGLRSTPTSAKGAASLPGRREQARAEGQVPSGKLRRRAACTCPSPPLPTDDGRGPLLSAARQVACTSTDPACRDTLSSTPSSQLAVQKKLRRVPSQRPEQTPLGCP